MPDTLYYDGQCPLCVKEMDRLRELKSDSLELRDIHSLEEDATDAGGKPLPDRETLLKVLHLERDGRLLTGVDANVGAWEHTRYAALWRWMRWPLLRPVVAWFYDRWAIWRYNRLYLKNPR